VLAYSLLIVGCGKFVDDHRDYGIVDILRQLQLDILLQHRRSLAGCRHVSDQRRGDAAGKVVLVAGVTSGEVGRIKAGEVVAQAASLVGGRGGGRPDFAQAGGTDAAKLPEALAAVVPFVRNRLGV
jgi:alanyl-tRNA synthetase